MQRSSKTRRLLLWGLAVAIAILGLLAVWGFGIEPDRLVVRKTALCVPLWPAKLEGFRVALLSDLHVGAPFLGLEKLRHVVAETNRARPQIVFLLGDYVIHGVRGGQFVEPEAIARELQLFKAPLGTYAVLGNHDWWYDGERISRVFEGAGITVLENEAARVTWKRDSFWVLGLEDLWTRKPDASAALQRIPPGEAILALTHHPDLFPELPQRIGLTLAGHTHGGQVWLPLLGRPVVPSKYGQRYAIGHIQENGHHLYVTPGIGTSIVPVRFGVPPEVSVLTLEACPQ